MSVSVSQDGKGEWKEYTEYKAFNYVRSCHLRNCQNDAGGPEVEARQLASLLAVAPGDPLRPGGCKPACPDFSL